MVYDSEGMENVQMDFQFGHIDFVEMHRCSYSFFTLDHKISLKSLTLYGSKLLFFLL